jgi:hypothetical protein
MHVFLSWSGHRSRAVAEILNDWLQCVIQAIRPWMSSKDIDRGSLWFSEISDQLRDTKLGIICLTKDNQTKPWILFESGALAKGLTSARVCTFLIDLEPAEVGNPLAQFNHTLPDKEGVYQLVRTLNSNLGEKSLTDKVLDQVFDTYWPQFEKSFRDAVENHPPSEVIEPRSEGSMLAEVLRTVRSLDRRVRSLERPRAPTLLGNASGPQPGSVLASIRERLRLEQEKARDLLALGHSQHEVEIMLFGDNPADNQRMLVAAAAKELATAGEADVQQDSES